MQYNQTTELLRSMSRIHGSDKVMARRNQMIRQSGSMSPESMELITDLLEKEFPIDEAPRAGMTPPVMNPRAAQAAPASGILSQVQRAGSVDEQMKLVAKDPQAVKKAFAEQIRLERESKAASKKSAVDQAGRDFVKDQFGITSA